MAIIIDRKCLQHVVDVFEGKLMLTEDEIKNVVRQFKMLIKVDEQKEQGKNIGGRPRKPKEIQDWT